MLSRKRQLRRFRSPGGAPAAIALAARCLFVLVVLTPDYPARAQEAQVVTFEDAVRIALEQNTDLKRAQNNARLRDVLVTQERIDFLLDLQLSSGGTRSFGRSFSQEEGQIINETSDFFGADASASVNLFNGFEKVASLRRAGFEEEASSLRLERTRQDVVFQVIDGSSRSCKTRRWPRCG